MCPVSHRKELTKAGMLISPKPWLCPHIPHLLAPRQSTPRAGTLERSLQLLTIPNTQTLLRVWGRSTEQMISLHLLLLPLLTCWDHKILRAGLLCRLQLLKFLSSVQAVHVPQGRCKTPALGVPAAMGESILC